MPVTVSVPLTTFEDVATMYDYLAGEGVTNVNFKLTGYANGGMYSEVPYKLKWEKSVGGASGFEELTAYAAEKGFEIFPDFDFVYTTQADGGSKVNMKKNAARTIENRYTSRRLYSATKQGLVSYYQMVLAPETYSKFYEKLGKKYEKYENATGISLATFGNALNSDFDEDKSVLREEAKQYVLEALAYFKNDYNVMLDGGNAYTWGYADHILNIPLDSSRYTCELSTVPFMGVVLHGYVEFAGTPVNMEGNLTYAMLKAMENGASVYFVLSYANTELLKEDVLLSQNYSVRYDIWQNRLVEIYKELNAVLADVQTKLIIDHKFLDGTRTPDEDELLVDIEQAALDKAAAIEKLIQEKHDAEVLELRAAREAAVGAAAKINAFTNYVALIDQERASVASTQTKYLLNTWNNYLSSGTPSATNLENFKQYFDNSIVFRYFSMRKDLDTAAKYVLAAKEGYEYLLKNSNEALLHNTAAAGLADAVAAYENLLSIYHGQTATLASLDGVDSVEKLKAAVTLSGTVVTAPTDLAGLEEYILGTNPTPQYDGIGMEELYRAFVTLMELQGIYDPADPENSAVNIKAIEDTYTVPPTTNPGGTTGGTTQGTVDETTPINDKYAIDSDIVLVTYGEMGTPYKSLILNFNNYAVQTTLENGVTYTIEAYGYVVIYH